MPWQALATGDLAERLRVSLDEILVAVESHPGLHEDPWTTLLYEYADRAASSAVHAAAATRIFERAVASVPELGAAPTLYGGFTGVAWLATHLTEPEPGDEDPNAEIDATLHAMLAKASLADYDLIGGLVGIGVYFLERLDVPAAREQAARSLALIVDRLGERATIFDAGAAWFTPADQLMEAERKFAPNGFYNLGVAHGMPGVIGLLGAVCGAGIDGRARELLDQSVAWLLAQAAPDGASRFSPWVVAGTEPHQRGGSRLAWCYGDLGIAAALFQAARHVGEVAWERAAIDIARRQATRRDASTMVDDGGLCHGTAGIAHIFNRLHQATGDAALADAARFWLARTLEMRRPGEGIAGYCNLRRTEAGEPTWESSPSFLTGTAGIGLAILAAISDVEPRWDRLLLVSA